MSHDALIPSPHRQVSIDPELFSSGVMFDTLFEIGEDCLKILDLNGRILRISKSGQRALEIDDVTTLEMMPWVMLWPENKRELIALALEKARLGQTAEFQSSCLTFKGHEKFWHVVVAPVTGIDGRTICLIVKSCNITGTRNTNRLLREGEAKLLLGLSLAGIGLGLMDFVADTITLDATAGRLFDLPSDTALPRAEVHARFHPDDAAEVERTLALALQPDGSGFVELEHRLLLPDRTEPWLIVRKQINFASHGGNRVASPFDGLVAVRDITARKQAQSRIQDLMNEVNHRSKNLLSVVQAVARQTARGSDPRSFLDRLTKRIAGLAASQDLLIQNDWLGVDLADLVTAQLSHFGDLLGQRLTITGPKIMVSAAAAQSIGMAIFELGTNAAKYGALSNDKGHVHIGWTTGTPTVDHISMSWVEEGGPIVQPPTREGFGHCVIVTMLESSLSGTVHLDYSPDGLRWLLEAPIDGTQIKG